MKQPVTLAFQGWSASLAQPGDFVVDFGKMDRVGVLHQAFLALRRFHEVQSYRSPNLGLYLGPYLGPYRIPYLGLPGPAPLPRGAWPTRTHAHN